MWSGIRPAEDIITVLIWTPEDIVRAWLDGHGAVDLHTGAPVSAPDPLQVAAAKLIVDEQYNGLSSGRGKDAAVQLLRAFTDSGYPLDEDACFGHSSLRAEPSVTLTQW